jgi:site-specific DNA recombinase
LRHNLKRTQLQIDKLLDAYQEGLVQLEQLRQRVPELRRKQQTAQKELDGLHRQPDFALPVPRIGLWKPTE